MAKHKQPAEIQTGTARITGESGLKMPDPQIDTRKQTSPVQAKKDNEHLRGKAVEIGSSYLMQTFARTSADNRLSRLVELSRTDNDVKWLLGQYTQTLSQKKT